MRVSVARTRPIEASMAICLRQAAAPSFMSCKSHVSEELCKRADQRTYTRRCASTHTSSCINAYTHSHIHTHVHVYLHANAHTIYDHHLIIGLGLQNTCQNPAHVIVLKNIPYHLFDEGAGLVPVSETGMCQTDTNTHGSATHESLFSAM